MYIYTEFEIESTITVYIKVHKNIYTEFTVPHEYTVHRVKLP